MHRRAGALTGNGRLLVVIGQLEECVTLCTPDQRDAFLALIDAWLAADPRVTAVATVRVEFLGTFQEGPTAHLFSLPFGVGPLSAAGLRRVITGPADASGVTLDNGLVELMVGDASGSDALPLMGYVLEQLYEEHRDGGRITVADYEQAGGVAGAVARHADRVLAALAARHGRERVLQTLMRFVTWQGVEPTRRRVARSELDDVALDIVERFRNARLMVDAGDSFDLAHEALLRNWEPLTQLARAHESELRRRAELQSLAFTWERYGRKDGYLLFGEYLDEARDVLANERVSPLVGEFVQASLAADAFHRRRLADQLATHSLRVRDEDPQLALALAYTAVVECAGTPSAAHALRSALRHSLKLTLRGHQDWIRSLAWSPDGRLASACDDGTIRIWTVEGGGGSAAAVLRGHKRWVRSVAWSPDGRLASGGDDGTVRLWTADGRIASAGNDAMIRLWGLGGEPRVLGGHTGAVRGLAWSPSGLLASGGEDSTVRLWRGGRQERVFTGHRDWVRSVAWSPTGELATTGTDGIVHVRVVGIPEPVRTLCGHEGAVRSVAWSSTGQVAAAHVDGTVRIWGPRRRDHPRILAGHDGLVWSVAWSPGGRLASAGADGTIRIWSPSPETPPTVLVGHRGPIGSVAWHGEHLLASASDDSTVRVWDAATASEPLVLDDHRGPVSAVAWSQRGHLASGGLDGTTRVWDFTRSTADLLAEARRRNVRPLTQQERSQFLLGSSRWSPAPASTDGSTSITDPGLEEIKR